MKIALFGYGKMGKSIERIALERGHSISLKATSKTDTIDFSDADVAIDFSLPTSAVNNIKYALDANIPVISGTTGWLEHYEDVTNYCKSKNGSFLYASNFSLGVNIFFEINKKVSQIMSGFKDYTVKLEEIHHTEKLDAPSGTAITLAEEIIAHSHYETWALDKGDNTIIPVMAKRIEHVPGTHQITYDSDIDAISIKHTAHSRQGFALGAVIAAEWIRNKNGIFSMKDVLNIG